MKNMKSTTYAFISSIISILLCAVMLVGTTFAWYTDEAGVSVMDIQAGTFEEETTTETTTESTTESTTQSTTETTTEPTTESTTETTTEPETEPTTETTTEPTTESTTQSTTETTTEPTTEEPTEPEDDTILYETCVKRITDADLEAYGDYLGYTSTIFRNVDAGIICEVPVDAISLSGCSGENIKAVVVLEKDAVAKKIIFDGYSSFNLSGDGKLLVNLSGGEVEIVIKKNMKINGSSISNAEQIAPYLSNVNVITFE